MRWGSAIRKGQNLLVRRIVCMRDSYCITKGTSDDAEVATGPLSGKHFCFSGGQISEAVDMINQHGGCLLKSLSSDCTHLIVSDKGRSTSKSLLAGKKSTRSTQIRKIGEDDGKRQSGVLEIGMNTGPNLRVVCEDRDTVKRRVGRVRCHRVRRVRRAMVAKSSGQVLDAPQRRTFRVGREALRRGDSGAWWE